MAVHPSFKCLSFMRHSTALHNEAAATAADAMRSVYLSEAYADASLSPGGQALVRNVRESKLGLSPAPSVVLCSPLTRAIQTAIAMFGGTGIRIVAVPEVREAYGRFPCDRHKDQSELELMFGNMVDFSLCDAKDTVWSPHLREDMAQLDGRVARFVDRVLQQQREASIGQHVFVVSHGVFIESALRQLAHAFPGHGSATRVHNCDVHSFVFSVPPPDSSTSDSPAAAPSPRPPPPPPPRPPPGGAVQHSIDGTMTRSAPSPNEKGAGSGGGGMSSGNNNGWGQLPVYPRVEAHLTGRGLDHACAAGMPLPVVAHVSRTLRRFSGDAGGSLTEEELSTLLAHCRLGPDEIRLICGALERVGGGGGGGGGDGGGRVAYEDILLPLMAFYSGEAGGGRVEALTVGSHARNGLVDNVRARYLMEMYGTPLANYELLDATFKRIISTVLSTPWW